MSSSQISTQTRSQTRCLSPAFQSNEEPNRKQLKSEKHSDCKTTQDSDDNSKTSKSATKGEESQNDSPAFRLRPRRSTPKSVTPSPHKRFSPFTAMMNRLKLLNNGSDVKRKLLFNKQKVYPSTFNSEELVPNKRIIPPRSPSCSVTEDIFVSPFVPKISTKELEADKEYGTNYLSLKIIFKEDIEINNQRMLKLIATDADTNEYYQPSTSKSNGTIVCEPKIAIYLFGSYVNCRAEKHKVINIVKFKTQSKLEEYDNSIDGDFDFAIVVKSLDERWVPFVSITNKWKAPEDPRELNKTLFQTPPEPIKEKPIKTEVTSNPSHKK